MLCLLLIVWSLLSFMHTLRPTVYFMAALSGVIKMTNADYDKHIAIYCVASKQKSDRKYS